MGKSWGKTVYKSKASTFFKSFPKVIHIFPQLFHKLENVFFRIGEEFSTTPTETLLLLLLLLLFPSNLAKHFILPQSYVLGIVVDYLIPTIYLTELLLLLLLISSALRKRKHRVKQSSPLALLILLFLLSLLPSFWVATEKVSALFRFVEISLWFCFSFWVSERISWEKHHRVFQVLGWGVFWVSLLALGQFLLQHYIFGYWFLGEPLLTPSLGGVAHGSLFGVDVLRAYGTFPHPDVLGGVVGIVLVWIASARLWKRFSVGVVGVLISLSRVAWVSTVGGLLSLLFLGGGMSLALINDFSLSRRIELLQSAWAMFKSAPLVGIGLGQFVSALPRFGLPSGMSLFLQPVHNIFALIAAESGVFALVAFLALLLFAFRETLRKRRFLLAISLLQLVFLGLFDHYLYTLPQGLFILSLTLGLSFSYSDK